MQVRTPRPPMRHRRLNVFKFVRFIACVIGLGVLIYFLIASCSPLNGKTLRVGLSVSEKPLAYMDDRKNFLGVEADFARMLADKLGKKSRLTAIKPEDMADALKNGSVDCVVSARQSVHDYISDYRMTSSVFAYGEAIVKSPDDDTIGTADDLAGKTVGILINSDAETLCDELLDRVSFNVRKYDFEAQPFQELKLGDTDALIADELYARYMQKENPQNYEVLGDIYGRTEFGVRLSDKLSEETARGIESAVRQLRADVALRDLFLQWFGTDLS